MLLKGQAGCVWKHNQRAGLLVGGGCSQLPICCCTLVCSGTSPYNNKHMKHATCAPNPSMLGKSLLAMKTCSFWTCALLPAQAVSPEGVQHTHRLASPCSCMHHRQHALCLLVSVVLDFFTQELHLLRLHNEELTSSWEAHFILQPAGTGGVWHTQCSRRTSHHPMCWSLCELLELRDQRGYTSCVYCLPPYMCCSRTVCACHAQRLWRLLRQHIEPSVHSS